MLEVVRWRNCGTDGGRTNLKIRLICFEILNMRSISSRKHKMEIIENVGKDGAENPDDPSNNFLEILNTGSIYFKKHEMEFR